MDFSISGILNPSQPEREAELFEKRSPNGPSSSDFAIPRPIFYC
ncbi:hypothetical protein CASFOL_002385 [Castilleja foliolosa]|uniref:Uncharacterized protein n=1 Tax=Castilleja foliolosa TaxID=1961234 RepID=A0ABD3EHN7_9LAMI